MRQSRLRFQRKRTSLGCPSFFAGPVQPSATFALLVKYRAAVARPAACHAGYLGAQVIVVELEPSGTALAPRSFV